MTPHLLFIYEMRFCFVGVVLNSQLIKLISSVLRVVVFEIGYFSMVFIELEENVELFFLGF